MLAMSGIGFGQKESKLLWEIPISSVNKIDYLSTAFCSKIGEESTLIGNNSGVNAIDKNGKIIWRLPYVQIIGTNNFLALRNDSLFRLDKELKFINFSGIPFPRNFSVIKEVEGGYILMNTNTNEIIKWNYEAKEMWRYKVESDIEFRYTYFSETTLGYSFNYSLLQTGKNPSSIFSLKLDKQGKQTDFISKKITPLYQFGTAPILAADKGVWLHESPFGSLGVSIMVRTDSTNKEVLRFDTFYLPNIINRTDAISIFKSERGYYDLPLGVTPNGSLIYGFYTVDNEKKPKSFFFAKIDGISKPTLTDEINMKENSIEDLPNWIKVIDDDNFIFSLKTKGVDYANLREIGGGIGTANFKIKNSIWVKKTDFKIGIEDGNTSKVIITARDNSLSIIRNDSLINYTFDGKVKWSKANIINQYNYLDKGIFGTELITYIFAIKDSVTTKIRLSDGKELWRLKLNPSKIVSEDSEGNCYLYREEVKYSPDFSRKYSLDFISKTGKSTSVYKSPNVDFNQIGAPFSNNYGDGRYAIDDKNKFFYAHAVEKQSDGTYQFVYRKYSTQCAYDLDPITIAGKTEACPTEKIKLSIPKQEGLTYQWQKDGKDIQNVKDAVYDFGEPGTYTVVAKDEICQNTVTSNALKINIRNLPNTEITAPKSIFCEGDKTVMTATTNGAFFQWQKDQKDIPNATSGIYEVSEPGNYRVGVRDDKCPQVGYSNVYTIITKLLPEATISTDIKSVVYEPFTVKMSANSGTGLAYQWLKDEVIIPNETKQTYEVQKSGKYKVNVTYDGCTKSSDALTINIQIPLANQQEVGQEQVQIYPNPNKGEFKIILPTTLKNAEIQLFDAFGRERSLIYVGEQAQADGLGQGVYFLRVQKGEKSVVNKIVIE